MTSKSVAIIGAGMSGLACAERLKAAGFAPKLFDKAHYPGGRMASRCVPLADGREIRFDHGAQYATAVDPAFAALLRRLEREKVAAPYPWPIFSQAHGGANADDSLSPVVGVEGMGAIPLALARGLDVILDRQVARLTHGPSGWRLVFSNGGSEGGFAAVVVAVPAEQAPALLSETAPALAREAAGARTAPCWAGLFVFEGGGEPAFGALRPDEGPIAWLARTGDGQGWVAHATAAWSRLNLEQSAEAVAPALEAAVRRLLPDVGETLLAQAHRWRHARVEVPATTPFAWLPDIGLGVCGDWRLGPRVELAWRSGAQLGEAMAAAGLPERA